MHFSKSLLLIILSFGLTFPSYSQKVEFDTVETLRKYLNAIHLEKGFNGEILVAAGNNILFQEAIGMASFENSLKVSIGAKYRIASITKTFTAALIVIAQEEKKLNIHEKAFKYISDLSPQFQEITIEQLLEHQSGLPHNEGIEDYWNVKSKLQLTTSQLLEEISKLDLLFKPGSQMSYSSLGYYLLAIILENIYKKSFTAILKDKVLNKLHMTETGIVDNLKIISNATAGYHLVSDDSLVVAPYRNYSTLKGAGDMYSTTTDLLKWNNSVYSVAKMNENTKAVSKGLTDGDVYGYGWFVKYSTPKKQYHGGGTWGYSSHIAKYAANNLSIIILSNISTLPMNDIASNVEKIVFGEPFEIRSTIELSKDSVDLELYTGDYQSDSNKMILRIARIENGLYAKLGGNPPFQIYPQGDHQFFGKKIEVEFTFEISNDLVQGLTAERMGQFFHFKKEPK